MAKQRIILIRTIYIGFRLSIPNTKILKSKIIKNLCFFFIINIFIFISEGILLHIANVKLNIYNTFENYTAFIYL